MLGALKAGDTFVGVKRGDPYRRGDEPVVYDFVVLRVARKYLFAKRADNPYGEYAFDRQTGFERSSYQPLRAFLDRAGWEKQQARERQVSIIARMARDLGSIALDRLLPNELDLLESLMLKATRRE